MSYHENDSRHFISYRLSRQLCFTDDTSQEPCNLIQPPLQTVHQHTGEGQVEEGTPFLQAISRPAWKITEGMKGLAKCSHLPSLHCAAI